VEEKAAYKARAGVENKSTAKYTSDGQKVELVQKEKRAKETEEKILLNEVAQLVCSLQIETDAPYLGKL